jgi:hypothetical protein
MDSKIITVKGFIFEVSTVFGHHIAFMHITVYCNMKQYFSTATIALSGRL